VFPWFSTFKEGRESLKDESRTGRPVSAHTNKNVESAREIVAHDRRITTRLLAVMLGIGTVMARLVLGKDLHKRKICSRFVSHSLNKSRERASGCMLS
jgi:histone-lysine N-methyltransferase SETMAR